MKKLLVLLLLTLLAPCVCACSSLPQLEHQAYPISLSIDKTDDDKLSIAVQVPRLSNVDASSGQSAYAIFSASARTYPEALQLLEVTVPSELRLSHLKSIVVSEQLARSDLFPVLIDSLIQTYHLYGTAKVIISTGNAQKFIEAQQPTVGIRLSSSVVAMLDHFEQKGYTPSTTLYGLYSSLHSFYSDPIATLAATWESPDEKSTGGSGGGSGSGDGSGGGSGSSESSGGGSESSGGGSDEDDKTPSGSGDSGQFSLRDMHSGRPGQLSRTGPDKNEYMGCALIKDGKMVGTLSGEESRWLAILGGTLRCFSYVCQDQPVTLRVVKRPNFSLTCAPDKLSIALSIAFEASPLLTLPELDVLRRQLESDISALFSACVSAGVEPFNLSEKAACQFPTAQAFVDYGFRERFLSSERSMLVSISAAKDD
ncbi:MAG: Ger(x)C family spore germination C-terminal domain-containing protein [Clostridia bacterium]